MDAAALGGQKSRRRHYRPVLGSRRSFSSCTVPVAVGRNGSPTAVKLAMEFPESPEISCAGAGGWRKQHDR